MCRLLGPNISLSGDKAVLTPPDAGRALFTWENCFLLFRGTEEGQSFLLASAASQATSIQNNQCAIVTYWGQPSLSTNISKVLQHFIYKNTTIQLSWAPLCQAPSLNSAWTDSFHPHNDPMEGCYYYRWGGWGPKRFSNLPQNTSPISARASIWTHICVGPWFVSFRQLLSKCISFIHSTNIFQVPTKCQASPWALWTWDRHHPCPHGVYSLKGWGIF